MLERVECSIRIVFQQAVFTSLRVGNCKHTSANKNANRIKICLFIIPSIHPNPRSSIILALNLCRKKSLYGINRQDTFESTFKLNIRFLDRDGLLSPSSGFQNRNAQVESKPERSTESG
jgi:hypothetical protein